MKEIKNIGDYSHTQGVYGLLNIVNHKIYVGSSCSRRGVAKRLNEHKSCLCNGNHPNPHLQNAWNRHGEPSFQFVMLEEVELEDDLVEREQYWMDFLKSHNADHGYNICRFAYSSRGRIMSEETKKKISVANKGKKRSDEFCELMSELKKGQTHSEESRKKMSKAHSGDRHWLYGGKHSQESIEKMRASHAGRIPSKKEVEKRAKSIRNGSRGSTSSGYKGVYWNKSVSKWQVVVDGVFAGLFEDSKDAALNYDYHMKRLFAGECYLNFPEYNFDGFNPKKEL